MNRRTLRRRLLDLGVREDSYDLSGTGNVDEAYVLIEEINGWHVFYSERGLRTGEMNFKSEERACEELEHRLTSDPTSQRFY